MRVRSRERGFSRKSYAPSLVALTAVSMVPWPLMMTTSGRVSGASCVDIGENFEAIAVGEPDVEQDDVVGCVLDEHEGLGRGGSAGDAVAFFAEDFFERGANFRLVVDHQDVVHEASPFRGVSVGRLQPHWQWSAACGLHERQAEEEARAFGAVGSRREWSRRAPG